jgi:hypothetical protein
MNRPLRYALTAVAAAAWLALPGCTQALAWFAAQFPQPKKVDALYQPPKGKTVLVLVEDRPKPVSYEPVKYELGERIGQNLVTAKVAREVVKQERLRDLSTQRDFAGLAVREVGARLGADLVVYVRIDSFSLKDGPESPLWLGRLSVSVWVFDVKGSGPLWPTDTPGGEGYRPTPIVLKHVENSSPSYGQVVAETLAEQMADRVAKIFYNHEELPNPHHDDAPPMTFE